MTINNRLDSSFGPVGSAAGIFIFIAGAIITWFSLVGIILIIVGAFVGFTSTCTTIDVDRRRIRFGNNLFGILKFGNWIDTKPAMKLGIRKSQRNWRAYSRGNRAFDLQEKDFRVVLIDTDSNKIAPLNKTLTMEDARQSLEQLSHLLGLPIEA